MITFNGNRINWEHNNFDSGINSDLIGNNSPICYAKSNIIDLNVNPPVYKFKITGNIECNFLGSARLLVTLFLANGRTVDWTIRKTLNNKPNVKLEYKFTLGIRPNWLNNKVVAIGFIFTHNPANPSSVRIKDLNISPELNLSNNDYSINLLYKTNGNGTGTSGPNGPK